MLLLYHPHIWPQGDWPGHVRRARRLRGHPGGDMTRAVVS